MAALAHNDVQGWLRELKGYGSGPARRPTLPGSTETEIVETVYLPDSAHVDVERGQPAQRPNFPWDEGRVGARAAWGREDSRGERPEADPEEQRLLDLYLKETGRRQLSSAPY